MGDMKLGGERDEDGDFCWVRYGVFRLWIIGVGYMMGLGLGSGVRVGVWR